MQNKWQLYTSPPAFVLGFHGCDCSIGESILAGQLSHLTKSNNEYDWLGTGIYFWEASPQRALEFAIQSSNGAKVSKGRIKTPFVLGAILELRHCFNLIDSEALQELKFGSSIAEIAIVASGGTPRPNEGTDFNLRFRDRAAIETVHAYRRINNMPEYDSVRSAFWEGEELYPSAGFREKNHIQLCVRNTDCIKGYFRPIQKI
ncbi:hypothetical protein AAKU67_002768 [Oxalobacteraceae bacterium GrIS 2.11]